MHYLCADIPSSLDMVRRTFRSTALFLICIVWCSCSDVVVDLRNGYFYRNEGDEIKDIHSEKGDREIPATVTAYAFDDEFILARQKPKLPADPLYNEQPVYVNGPEHDYYWIIDHKQETIWGPLDEQEYLRTRSLAGVPSELTLPDQPRE